MSNYIVSNRTQVEMTDGLGNNIVQYKLVQNNEEVISQTDNSAFNIASILNLSFGMELPISNWNQSLVIEPYFKYSLKPITVQKVDYTRGGIRLIMLFDLKKK